MNNQPDKVMPSEARVIVDRRSDVLSAAQWRTLQAAYPLVTGGRGIDAVMPQRPSIKTLDALRRRGLLSGALGERMGILTPLGEQVRAILMESDHAQ